VCAPSSYQKPASVRAVQRQPPGSASFSSTSTRAPERAAWKARLAPLIPPPTMIRSCTGREVSKLAAPSVYGVRPRRARSRRRSRARFGRRRTAVGVQPIGLRLGAPASRRYNQRRRTPWCKKSSRSKATSSTPTSSARVRARRRGRRRVRGARCTVGKTNEETSTARLAVRAKDPDALDRDPEQLSYLGAVSTS
jgi:hypothetical protein